MVISQKILFVIFAILTAAMVIVSIIATSSRYAEIERLVRINTLSSIDDRLKDVFAAISDFPGSAGKDILFLKTLTQERDLRNFIRNNGVYNELYLFDDTQRCVARVDGSVKETSICGVVPDVVATIVGQVDDSLSSDAVYISPLVLYDAAPALLYAAVRDNGDLPAMPARLPERSSQSGAFYAGRQKGTIVSVVHADYFLEEIRRLTRDGESVYLLLRDGGYLAHPDRAREKLTGGEANFYRDFPDIPGGALDDPHIRRFETNSQIFTFWRIYPSASNFAIHEGVSALYGKEQADEYYWVMATVSEKPDIGIWWQQSSYLVTIVAILLMCALAGRSFLLVFRSPRQ